MGVGGQMVWLERKRERRRAIGERRAFLARWPVGGPIVMQRCINNATGLLNALLPWGPLCLGEQRVYVCVLHGPRGRKKEKETQT